MAQVDLLHIPKVGSLDFMVMPQNKETYTPTQGDQPTSSQRPQQDSKLVTKKQNGTSSWLPSSPQKVKPVIKKDNIIQQATLGLGGLRGFGIKKQELEVVDRGDPRYMDGKIMVNLAIPGNRVNNASR